MKRLLILTLVFTVSLGVSGCRSKTRSSASGPQPPSTPAAANLPDEASLRAAAVNGDTPAVKALLDKGVNVNAKDSEGRTALTEASYFGHTEIAKLLVDHGADILAKKNDGSTPLTIAGPHQEITEMFQRSIELLEVAGKGDTTKARELLEKGACINVRDLDGRTPLTESVWGNHIDTVRLLLDKGADAHISKVDGATPLSIATNKDYKEIVELLKKAK
jgi:ankyrin repeat protein